VIAEMETAFDRATAVVPDGEGAFTGTIDESWSAPLGPNGGYLAALAIRALEAGVDPQGERRLRSLTCHYLRRPEAGPIELRPETVRSGRRLATGRLSAFQNGKEVLAAIAAFAAPELVEIANWTPSPPAVEPPEAGGWVPFEDGNPPLLQHLRMAPRIGGPPFSGRELKPGEGPIAGGWVELAEPRPIDAALVALITDVWWPPALEPLTVSAGAPTIDLTIHFRADLPPEGLPAQPVLGVYRSAAALSGLVEEDGEVYLGDGTLLAQSRQLALLAPFNA
jgi:acyl-coenzyme A thioesterase PaaI-like protein